MVPYYMPNYYLPSSPFCFIAHSRNSSVLTCSYILPRCCLLCSASCFRTRIARLAFRSIALSFVLLEMLLLFPDLLSVDEGTPCFRNYILKVFHTSSLLTHCWSWVNELVHALVFFLLIHFDRVIFIISPTLPTSSCSLDLLLLSEV